MVTVLSIKDKSIKSDPNPSLTLKDIDKTERPQERIARLGPQALSDHELIAMILRSGTKGQNVLNVAQVLLNQSGSLHRLLNYSLEDFKKVKGIGNIKALQLITVMELSKRILYNPDIKLQMDSPDKIFKYFEYKIAGLEVEKVWVLSLNRRNYLIKESVITVGVATGSLIHPREIFREAIRVGAAGIIVVHNHPSGDPNPSKADIKAAKQLAKSAMVIDICLVDFLIVGSKSRDKDANGYYSFRKKKLLP
tara:strand:+ start:675 stop:1427 length:753 start_codon:yes stop_codon:yes gene_type:complete